MGISACHLTMAGVDGFGPEADIVLQEEDRLPRISSGARLGQSVAVIPRHPRRRMLRQLLGVFLQGDEIVEGIDAVQFASVDQAHKQIAHLGTVLGLIK
jgi:hypothetical protein